MSSSIDRRQFVQASSTALAGLLLNGPLSGAADEEVHVCPKSYPPAKALFAIRLEELTSYGWDMRLTLTCLQGIVNRSQPRLYLIHDRYDELWLEWLRERGDVDDVKWLEVGEVFDRFLPEVKQAFVIDFATPATINAATMLAAVSGGLVVTPRTAAQYNLPSGGTSLDFSKGGLNFGSIKFKKDVEVYRWVFQEVGDQLSRQIVAVLDPQEVAHRDYLVEFKVPVLWISGPEDVTKNSKASPDEEKEFARDILMKWPPNIPCLGWPGSGELPGGIGEGGGVRLTSECAKYTVVTGNDGHGPTVGNLSVHSGTSVTPRRPPMPAAKLDRKKVHVCFCASDGDGPNFVRLVYRQLHDQQRRTNFLPVGWEFQLADFDLMPNLLDYFYKKGHPGDSFVIALTGLGYVDEDHYADNFAAEEREKILRDYVQVAGQYATRFEVNILTTWNEMSAERLRVFAKMPGITAILANYARRDGTTFSNLVSEVEGVPVFRAVNGVPGNLTLANTSYARREAESLMLNDIKRWTPVERPAFLYVSLTSWFTRMEMLENIIEGLGSEYVAVPPDQFVSLYRQSRA